MPVSTKDEVGRVYGLLTVLRPAPSRKGAWWECQCQCGSVVHIRGNSLRRGVTRSCGCLASNRMVERNRIHGMARHPAYHSYFGAMARCRNSKSPDYARYGGRGIQFLFESFTQFWVELGPTWKSGLSLDRINNDGHYESGNCKWSTVSEQGANKRNNVNLTYKGRTASLAEWSRIVGLKRGTVYGRYMRHGLNPLELFKPVTELEI